MLDHIGFGASDIEASRAFYLKALAPLGIGIVKEVPGHGFGLGIGAPMLWIAPAAGALAPMHIAFQAADRAQVEAFHRAALAAGARDNGAPGLRTNYHPDYYAAFVIGPDGHNLEAVCHAPKG